MSIQSEIDRITAARDDIATAISEKGVTVESNNINGLADKVRQISQGGTSTRGVYEITFPDDTSGWEYQPLELGPSLPGDTDNLRYILRSLSYTCISGPEYIEYGSTISNIYLKSTNLWIDGSPYYNGQHDNSYYLSTSKINLVKSDSSLSYYDRLKISSHSAITGTYIIETEYVGYETDLISLYRPRSLCALAEVSRDLKNYSTDMRPATANAVGSLISDIANVLVKQVRGIAYSADWTENSTSGTYINQVQLYYSMEDEIPMSAEAWVVSPAFAVQTTNFETNKTLANVLGIINNGYTDDMVYDDGIIRLEVSEKIETDIELAFIIVHVYDIAYPPDIPI